jgi:uncharacterized membrane protein YebE (DUF533 family)
MFDPKQLLDQVLGGGNALGGRGGPGGGLSGGLGGGLGGLGQQVRGRLDSMGGTGGFAGGAAVGGLLGMLLGGGRKRGGGLASYGTAAAIGALALHAYQAYQRGQAVQSTVPMNPSQVQNTPAHVLPHAAPAADGGAFELVLIRAMVGAAKADGHLDAVEQQALFGQVEKLGLDSEAKGYVFDLLNKPVDLDSIAGAVATPEQGAEVYLASRLAIDPDQASSGRIWMRSRGGCGWRRSCGRIWIGRRLRRRLLLERVGPPRGRAA